MDKPTKTRLVGKLNDYFKDKEINYISLSLRRISEFKETIEMYEKKYNAKFKLLFK